MTALDSIGFGIDVSHWQDPAKMPWDRIKASADFVICRASYGGGLRDRRVVEHMQLARDLHLKVGLYQFYRPSQTVDSHFAMLRLVADVVGYGDGDILPVLDIEADQGVAMNPKMVPAIRELVERMKDAWGGAMIYVTQADWHLMGKPIWMLDYPLWVAHYTSKEAPASPAGKTPHIWQHRVGPFDPMGPGGFDKKRPEYDHNRLIQPLPLVGEHREKEEIPDDEVQRILGLVALTSDEEIRHRESDEGQLRSDRRCS